MSPSDPNTDWTETRPSLIQRACSTDVDESKRAWNALCSRYRAAIERAVARRVGSRAPVEELANEVQASLYLSKTLPNFDPLKGPFRAYLQGVVANVVRSRLKADARTERDLRQLNEEFAALDHDAEFIADEERSWANGLLERVVAHLRDEDPRAAECLCAPLGACGYPETSRDELARRHSLTKNALYQVAYRASQLLVKFIDAEIRETVKSASEFESERALVRKRLLEAAPRLLDLPADAEDPSSSDGAPG